MSIELELKEEKNVVAHSPRGSKLQIDALLIFITLIWGGTFLVVQNTIKLTGPFTFLTIRFSFAALALMLIFHKRLARITRRELITGGIIGLFLFATYALQTCGLQYTTTSKAGFITALYVPLVPLLSILLLRQWPTLGAILGVGLSLTGLSLLSINDQFNLDFGLGEFLVFACAITCSLHIVSISKFAPKVDAINLAIVQITVTALLSLMAMPLAGEPFALPPLPVWGSAFFMGLIATSFPLVVMNRVQQFISSTRATLIYALEPVFAGFFGYLSGELLTMQALLGCALIFMGMIMAELKPRELWQTLSLRKRAPTILTVESVAVGE
ncbi:MAG: DMT family transporter [Chloroflexota bacterium]|nr:DMT family transporter [Chloroflexota bacterium]